MKAQPCQAKFLGSNPLPLPQEEVKRLEAKDLDRARIFKKQGRQQEPALLPCHRIKQSAQIVEASRPEKRLRSKTATNDLMMSGLSRPCKRLRTKTPAHLAHL